MASDKMNILNALNELDINEIELTNLDQEYIKKNIVS